MYENNLMTESNKAERGSMRKELRKLENERKVVIPGDKIDKGEESSMIDYNTEDRLAASNIKISPTEVKLREQQIQDSYKTPEQVSDEDYKVGPTSADEKRVRSETKE
jgi:hypothetical protein